MIPSDPDKTIPPKVPGEDETQPPAQPTAADLSPTGPWTQGAGVPFCPGTPLPCAFGRYRLEKQLGQGGMGVVYRSYDTQLGRTVALKIPLLSHAGNVRRRFLREAQSAAALAHPNICPIYDVGELEGVPFLVMAFIQGKPLSQQLEAGPLEAPLALALTRQIALALHEAHQRGVIHRDLKPANVMIDDRGEPVIMDFGLARRSDVPPLTLQGELMGTPAYMPPEQVAGDAQAMGPASDIYSLGVVLFKMLTGTVPFQGDILTVLSQIALDTPPPLSSRRSGLDPRLDRICLKALAKRPADRWSSMRELADALEPLLTPTTDPPVPVAPTGLPPKAPLPAALTLRILGTPFAYRPAPGQEVITLGRQKRKPGVPDDQGNDVVVRVPGNDQLSARISRRHLEIHRRGGQHVVLDHSKAGTLRNGRPLPHDVAVPLEAGDLLVLAGVVTLEVLLHNAPTWRLAAPEVEVAQATGPAPVVLEASLGDMVTAE